MVTRTPQAHGQTMAAPSVFVFCAEHDERVAFSMLENGANLPPSVRRSPWLPTLRTSLSLAALALFNVDAGSASEALRNDGYYLGHVDCAECCWPVLVP